MTTYGRTRRPAEDFITGLFERGDLIEHANNQRTGIVSEVSLDEADTCEMHEWVTVLWDDGGKRTVFQDTQYSNLINLSKKAE